ncbi:M48 family metalloprotease [Pseudodesulfovibrio sp. zrk46]|nr:M48 family metalloprotease [Pseudodesulfovibrio sp. zrk46]
MLLILAPAMNARAGVLTPDKLTIRKENEMGRNFDRLIRQQMSMVGDTYITDYVDELVQNVVKGKRPMPFKVRSAVVANPLLNAFAIPGGYIYIFTGLIQDVTSESQLVGVIAHELAHVSQRHVASRLEKQGKIGMLTMAGVLAGIFLGMAGGSNQAGAALMAGAQGIGTAAMLQYSQDDEREADHVGLNSMIKAGYNPEGMPQTFEIMKKKHWFDNGRQNVPSYLSTHPGLSERITYLNDRIKRMPKTLTERKDDNAQLKRVQALVRSKLSAPDTALGYYISKPENTYTALDYMAVGVIQERLKARDKAQIAIEKALQMAPKDPLVSREAGIFYFKSGDRKKAFQYLQMAVIKNQRDALGLFYFARLQAENDQYKRAAENMRKVMEIVPEDWEVHHHLGMILGESGDQFGGNLQLAYAALYGGNKGKARYHKGLAAQLAKTPAQQEELKQFDAVFSEWTKPVK